MGLDAVVYKHRSKLPLDPERAGLRMEESAREWYCENAKCRSQSGQSALKPWTSTWNKRVVVIPGDVSATLGLEDDTVVCSQPAFFSPSRMARLITVW
jgi:hypothetical protein